MKKILVVVIVICLGVFLFAFGKNEIIKNSNNVKISTVNKSVNNVEAVSGNRTFTPADTTVLGIELGMSREEVEEKLGKPLRVKKEYAKVFEADVLKYYYNFGIVTLDPLNENDYSVSDILINQINYKGFRGVQVNDSVDLVLQKFPYNKDAPINKDGQKYIYGSENTKERGYICYDENGNIQYILFFYGEEGFGCFSLGFTVKDNKIVDMSAGVDNAS